MKNFQFSIEMTNIGLGYVEAESLEEAIEKINNGEYDDIYDEVGTEYGKMIEIKEV